MARRCAGINIPIFSLRSKKSLGSGEFLDLIPLIDWAHQTGLKIIQLLPINDTTLSVDGSNGHPYSILSAFSLHPVYLNLQSLSPELDREIIHPLARELNLPGLDYERTYFVKSELIKMLFILRGKKDLSSKSFQSFFKKNESHLKAYATFCFLRDKYGTSDFHKWGRHKKYSELLIDEILEKNDLSLHYFTQYHLDRQLSQVVDYARKKGVLLKGDFPIGVHPHSVEAWRFNEYFRWDQTIGAPPDFYNSLGQNWGFPSYNWDEIKEEGYFWLKSRLKWMESYFDILRLDHVLGYFRLWEIPNEEVRGIMGHFYPSIGYSKEELAAFGLTDLNRLTKPHQVELQKDLSTQIQVKEKIDNPKKRDALYTLTENRLFFFREGSYHPRINLKETESFRALSPTLQKVVFQLFQFYFSERQEELWHLLGLEKLKLIQKSTKMEICAEDIGVIPDCVAAVLSELNIPNLHVQRMPKSFELLFEKTEDFPTNCVCTPSNHDTATLREWWKEDKKQTSHYYHTILKHVGEPPDELTGKLARQIIASHLNSRAKYAIFLLQDLLAMDDDLKLPHPEHERINDPSRPDFVWKWRMHLYIEELSLATSFNENLKEMIKESGR